MHPPLRPSHDPHWEVRSWGEDQTGLLLLSPGPQVSSGGRGRKRERERKRSGECGRPGLLSPETSRAGGGRLGVGGGGVVGGTPPSRGSGGEGEGVGEEEEWEEEWEEEEQAGGGQAALLWWRRVPEDAETLEAVRGSGGWRREGKGRAAGEAEAAYQAVSCGDKQSPEVIGVHAACLLLLQDPGTAEEAGPRVGKRGRPMCTAGRQDRGGERGGQRRPRETR